MNFFKYLLVFSVLLIFPPVISGCSSGGHKPAPSPTAEATPEPSPEPTPDDFVDMPSDYYTELYRQQIHFSPVKGWMNDPNGLIYYEGEYHMFYQYTPDNPAGGWPEWGHAVSKDLIHWEDLGIAIGATSNSQIWSGSCVVDDKNTSGLFEGDKGGLVAIYTRLQGKQEQCIAYSSDKGRTWTKYNSGKPVLTANQDPLNKPDGFRDPKVFRHEEGQCWVMCVGGDAVRIYTSQNLIDWTFQISYEKEQTVEGRTIPPIYTECPDLFKMTVKGTSETKWVLSLGGTHYIVGDFINSQGKWVFVPDSDEFLRFNQCGDSYAGQTYYNTPDGRRIMVCWLRIDGNPLKQLEWTPKFCGSMSVNTELSLVKTPEGLRISQKPVEEMSLLEMNYWKNAYSEGPADNLLSDFSSEMYKLDIEVANGYMKANLFGGDVTVSYSVATETLTVDTLATGVPRKYSIPLPSVNGKMTLTIYADTSSVEVFANEGLVTASCLVFGSLKKDLSLSFSGDGYVRAKATKLNSMWRDLRFTKVDPVPLELPSGIFTLGSESVITLPCGRLFTNVVRTFEIISGNDCGEITHSDNDSVTIKGLSEGRFTLKVTEGSETVTREYDVYKEAFNTNLTDFVSVGTPWETDEKTGLRVNASGDSFYTASEKASDSFRYDISLINKNAVAVGIVLGCTNVESPNSDCYVINFDMGTRQFRIFRFNNFGARDLAVYKFSDYVPENDVLHSIEIVYENGSLSYSIDNRMIFENISLPLENKHIGVMVFSGSAIFKNITYDNLSK